MTKIINLTPHAVVVINSKGDRVTFPASGQIARVASRNVTCGPIETEQGDFAFSIPFFGAVEGIPDPDVDTLFIVSALVRDAAGRADVISPDTGPTAIREAGLIVAVRGFLGSTALKGA